MGKRDREKECNDNRIGQAFCPAGHNPLFPSLFASSLVAVAALESRRRAKERERVAERERGPDDQRQKERGEHQVK